MAASEIRRQLRWENLLIVSQPVGAGEFSELGFRRQDASTASICCVRVRFIVISQKYDLGALTERVRVLKRQYQELLEARERVVAASAKFRATLTADVAAHFSNVRMNPKPTRIANTSTLAAKRIFAIH